MTRFTSTLAAILVLAAVGGAAAQTPNSTSAQRATPRVELGGGFTGAVPLSTDSEGFGVLPVINSRVGVALKPGWALEGAFDIWPDSYGATTIYRAQARWQLGGASASGRLQTHLTFGGAGWLSRRSYPESRWQDPSGTTHVYPARSSWSAGPPIYPTIGIGVQKTLGRHAALRADLAAIVTPFDDGAAVLLMPTIGVSIPIGRGSARVR